MSTVQLPPIIGFTGQATAGKTLSATIVSSHFGGYVRMSFADPIRDMLLSLGITREDMSERKNQPHPLLCGRTPRYALQKLGTEWGRDLIGGDIWASAALNRAARAHEFNDLVVFDDVRFGNEAYAIRRAGGIIIEVSRPGLPPRMDHASERGVTPALISHYVHATDAEDLKVKLLTLFNTHYAV